jgi:hypothetical protein
MSAQRIRVVPDRLVAARGRDSKAVEAVGRYPTQHERNRQHDQKRAGCFHDQRQFGKRRERIAGRRRLRFPCVTYKSKAL